MRVVNKHFVRGDLVMLKNRKSGVFEPTLVGPFEFLEFKQGSGKAAVWLQDMDGNQFDASAAHIVLASYDE